MGKLAEIPCAMREIAQRHKSVDVHPADGRTCVRERDDAHRGQ